MPPDSKETKLGSSDQEAFPAAGKTTSVVLVPCCTWKCVPTAVSGGVDISLRPWMLFVTADELSVRVIKITLRIGAS